MNKLASRAPATKVVSAAQRSNRTQSGAAAMAAQAAKLPLVIRYATGSCSLGSLLRIAVCAR